MRTSSTARRYAEASYDVAEAHDQVDTWLDEMGKVDGALRDTDLAQVFKDPHITDEARIQTVDAAFASVRPEVLNLLRILANRQRLHLFPGIFREFESLVRAARGILEADVTVARSLEENEIKVIAMRLEQITGKTVEVRTRIDPAIVGGIIVRVGDRLVDASVAGKLQRLRQGMV